MNSLHVRSVATLSLLGGGALLLAPRATGALFGLPTSSAALLRVLGARDVAIGAALLSGAHRAGMLARGVSDAFDTALIVREGIAGRTSLAGTVVRAAIGGASALFTLHAALSDEQAPAEAAG